MQRRPIPLLLATAAAGFILVVAVRAQPGADREARLPRRFEMAALIERESAQARALRAEVVALRADVDRRSLAATGQEPHGGPAQPELDKAALAAGVRAMRGPGLKVVLDDSSLSESPSGDVSDLVIHSQDVQAVVNAVWRSGAEAVSINGERLVSSSAVLCVGNTLLLNGTVHSPPYVVSAIGASRDRFEADSLVSRLHGDAKGLGLRFSVAASSALSVPAYRGLTAIRHARAVR